MYVRYFQDRVQCPHYRGCPYVRGVCIKAGFCYIGQSARNYRTLIRCTFYKSCWEAMTANWGDVEMFMLVKIWGEKGTQALLQRCTRDKPI